MQNYTHLTTRKLELKWLELIGRPVPPIGRSLIIKYLLWYEQAKREKISPLGFFYEVKQATHNASARSKATLEVGSKMVRSYQGIKYEVEIVAMGIYLRTDSIKAYPGSPKPLQVRVGTEIYSLE